MAKIKRRNFLQAGSATALAFALAGKGLRPAQAAREKELNIYCWEGYNSDDVLDPFRKEFAATVRAEGLTSDPDAVNRLRAGETKIWDSDQRQQPLGPRNDVAGKADPGDPPGTL